MAPLLRDRAGTAALANRATHFALPTREAARGGDTDRPSGLPRHGGGPGEVHAARQPASPARVHGADVQAPERPTADCGSPREPTSMTTRDARHRPASVHALESETLV